MSDPRIIVKSLRDTASVPRGYTQVRVDRASILGNPFPMKKENQRGSVIAYFRQYLEQSRLSRAKEWREIERLAQRVADGEKLALMCWCSPKPCHGDIIRNAILFAEQRLGLSRQAG